MMAYDVWESPAGSINDAPSKLAACRFDSRRSAPHKLRAFQVGALEAGATQIGLFEMCVRQVSSVEASTPQVGAAEIGVAQHGSLGLQLC